MQLSLASAPTTSPQVLAFYQLTHPKPAGAGPLQLRPGRDGRTRGAGASLLRSAASVPGPTLPAAIAMSGEYSGIVYTAPASRWRRADTIANWPPAAGPDSPHGFLAWEATVAQGTLVLRPLPTPPPRARGSSPRKAAGGLPKAPSGGSPKAGDSDGGSPAAAPPGPAAAKVGIPLEGCAVELVEDGLNGRSEFIRRAPLLVAHPRWPLLGGEPSFYLWAGALLLVATSRDVWDFVLHPRVTLRDQGMY